MEIISSEHPDIKILKPKIHRDTRGTFTESFRMSFINKINPKLNFVQDNESCSKYGVLRGIHFQQNPKSQSKLVRVVKGEILDIVIDLREESIFFGKVFKFNLSEENAHQLIVPSGFGHGFLSMSPNTIVQYKVDEYYSSLHDSGINPLSFELGLPINEKELIISEKDRNLPEFDINKKYF